SANAVHAVDLKKIERTIAKEPAYQTKPKYCLLVFGPEAKTRVWLVLDSPNLYVDRKGDGDLTAAANRVADSSKRPDPKQALRFQIKDNFAAVPGKFEFYMFVEVGRDRIYITFCNADVPRTQATEEEGFRFADRPQDAPILWFDGPLTFILPGR